MKHLEKLHDAVWLLLTGALKPIEGCKFKIVGNEAYISIPAATSAVFDKPMNNHVAVGFRFDAQNNLELFNAVFDKMVEANPVSLMHAIMCNGDNPYIQEQYFSHD